MQNLVLMVVVAAVALAAAAVQGESTSKFREKVEPVAKMCQAEASASDEDVKRVINDNYIRTKTGKCLLRCVYNKVGAMKGDVLVLLPELVKVYSFVYEDDPQKLGQAQSIVDKCHKQVTASSAKDGCEVAGMKQRCIIESHQGGLSRFSSAIDDFGHSLRTLFSG